MPLVLIPAQGTHPDQFSVYEGERKVGRIYKAEKNWLWSIDWFGVGQKLVTERTRVREARDVLFRRYWEWVTRTGIEELGKGQALTQEEAFQKFKTAWGYVTWVGGRAGVTP
jgi:hypothetical protein